MYSHKLFFKHVSDYLSNYSKCENTYELVFLSAEKNQYFHFCNFDLTGNSNLQLKCTILFNINTKYNSYINHEHAVVVVISFLGFFQCWLLTDPISWV